jgi:hypothetical protein
MENVAGLKNSSICRARGASRYFANNLSLGAAANSTAATSMRCRKAIKVICNHTATDPMTLIQVAIFGRYRRTSQGCST